MTTFNFHAVAFMQSKNVSPTSHQNGETFHALAADALPVSFQHDPLQPHLPGRLIIHIADVPPPSQLRNALLLHAAQTNLHLPPLHLCGLRIRFDPNNPNDGETLSLEYTPTRQTLPSTQFRQTFGALLAHARRIRNSLPNSSASRSAPNALSL